MNQKFYRCPRWKILPCNGGTGCRAAATRDGTAALGDLDLVSEQAQRRLLAKDKRITLSAANLFSEYCQVTLSVADVHVMRLGICPKSSSPVPRCAITTVENNGPNERRSGKTERVLTNVSAVYYSSKMVITRFGRRKSLSSNDPRATYVLKRLP